MPAHNLSGPPVTLSVAGSDNSGGAGVQADLKTFSAFGCYGHTAITCVVAEIPGKVAAIQAIKPEIVAEQIRLSFEGFPVAAAKTGMLFSTPIVEAVAGALSPHQIPLVVDPVMVASSGDPLLKKDAINAILKKIFPLAAVVTPNLDELSLLHGVAVTTMEGMKDAGKALYEKYGCAFLLKGGHLKGKTAIDVLVSSEGVEEFEAPYVRNVSTHGTGCTYSAAITAGLASGLSLSIAVDCAKKYITAAISQSLRWKKMQALQHFPVGPEE